MKNMVQTTTVATTQARPTVWQTQLRAVGSMHAVEGADLASEVAGLVTRIGFVAGQDVQVTFTPNTPGPEIAGLARVETGRFANGQWIRERMVNGDDVVLDYDQAGAAAKNQSGSGLIFRADGPTIQRVKLYRYR